MSGDLRVPKDELALKSLVPFTEIRDIKLVRLSAIAPEEPEAIGESVKVDLSFSNPAFRARQGELQILLPAKVSYSADAPDGDSDNESVDTQEFASIDMMFRLDLDLEPTVQPEEIDKDIISGYVDSNAIFMVYPYVRSTVQRVSGEMPFPHTVLPYLRRSA